MQTWRLSGMPRCCLFNSLSYRENGGENANTDGMGSINQISSSYLQSIFGTALGGAGSTNTLGDTQSTGSLSSAASQDNSRLSPFADILNKLQQLQETNPSQYQQVTQQIATNLQTAAQTAQANGNSTAATRLNQLSTDFKGASQSGQFPNVQDLAQAIAGGHHHHHHFHAASADSDGDSSANSGSSGNSSSTTNQTLSQFLSALQSNVTGNDALNPMAIMLNTLTNAGLSASN